MDSTDAASFGEPWEARAFALTHELHQRGLFSWKEWTSALSEQLAAAATTDGMQTGEGYYLHWLAALEALVAAKGLSSEAELLRYREAWEHAAGRTPHGQPIDLRRADFGDSPRATD
jgi:nitrile hydratase accessory protein